MHITDRQQWPAAAVYTYIVSKGAILCNILLYLSRKSQNLNYTTSPTTQRCVVYRKNTIDSDYKLVLDQEVILHNHWSVLEIGGNNDRQRMYVDLKQYIVLDQLDDDIIYRLLC